MKKIYTLLVVMVFAICPTLFAQQAKLSLNNEKVKAPRGSINRLPGIHHSNSNKCGFTYMLNQAKANGFDDARYEQKMSEQIAQMKLMRPLGISTIYTVPIIIHVIYDGNTEATIGTGANLEAAQIYAQIDQLNEDFANLAGSTYSVAQDMGIRFVPARQDDEGNLLCEPGIERINWRSKTSWVDPTSFSTLNAVSNHFSSVVKPSSIWSPYNYVNVWTAAFENSSLLGEATFPSNSTLLGLDNAETDQTAGVIIASGTVGSSTVYGTDYPYDLGKTMAHELGHFFGLRHIWGDALCGNDYCADTPPQDQETGECPAPGTLNNCTPSVPKMFENYMDYSYDDCLNTFTQNQTDRCQTVMLNSPRRKELLLSTKGNSPVPNRISFKPGVTAVLETGIGTCPRYRDYLVKVGIDNAATGAATITLNKSGTATNNVDYAVLEANATYTNGDITEKTFTVRVYDDATPEPDETITLSLAVTSGTGVQVYTGCPAANTYTITLVDDDVNTNVNNTTPVATLLSQNFGATTGSNQVPTGWTVTNAGTATNKWVGNSAGAATYAFTGNTLHISNGNAAAVNGGTAAMNYVATTTTDARVTTVSMNAAGLKNLNLSFNYVSNGEPGYDFGLIFYSTDAGATGYYPLYDALGNLVILQGVTTKTAFTATLPNYIAANSTGLQFLFRWISDNVDGYQPPFAIDDVVVTGDNVAVETAAAATATETVSSGIANNYFYSSTGKIIAHIDNLSASIGCITGSIQNAGTTLQTVTTNAGTFSRSDKVIKVSPTLANNTATYSITLYYTTAELAAWGANVPLLQILKVNDGVSLSTTLTSSNAKVFSCTVDDQRATKGYASFTSNVTGGFSQFMLTSTTTVIPVSLLSFEAKANIKNILLNWSTSTESNNKGFVVERSIDGIRFEKIGWVDGKLNSNQTVNYTYFDNFVQPNVVYHYRLRQTDTENREKLSEIKQAKIKASTVEVSISPNPAKDQLKLFVSGTTGLSDVTLVNTAGQVVRSWKKVNASSAPALLDVSNLAAGVYMMRVVMPESTEVKKLIIK